MASLFDLLHGLTKVEVTGPDGSPQFYNPPETDSGKAPGKNSLAFLQGVAKQEQAGVQPETDQASNVQIPDAEGNGGSQDYAHQDNSSPLAFMRPSFKQASTDSVGLPSANSPQLTTKGKVLSAILSGGLGALAGSKESNAGAGFQDAIEQPIQRAGQRQALQRGGLENQMLGAQIGNLPWQRAALIAGLQKSQAETGKFSADAAKSTAEAGAIPIKTALEAAQAEAANYKEDPNLGLIDIRTKQPVSNAGSAPLSDQEAAVLGKNPGDKVTLKLKNTANEIVNRGIRVVQANGRSLLKDGQGNTIKDMGAATPLVLNSIQNAGATGTPGKPSAISQAIADGSMKWSDAVSQRTPMAVKQAILKEVKAINPNFNSGDFAVEQAVKKDFTSGADSNSLNAINRAREHMKVFLQTAKDLDNGQVQAFNKIANAFGVQFGSDKATNLAIAKQAFSSEVGKAFAGASVAEGDRKQIGDQIGAASSFGQLAGVAKTADALLAGAQKVLKQKYDLGTKGKPNFGGQLAPSGGSTANPHSDLGFVLANQ